MYIYTFYEHMYIFRDIVRINVRPKKLVFKVIISALPSHIYTSIHINFGFNI